MELNNMRKELITRISHELRTPLTSVYGVTQALSSIYQANLNEDIISYVDIAHRGAIRLKELVDNLLDSSKLDIKKIELTFNNESLSQLLKECVREMIHLASNRDLTIDTEIPEDVFLEIDRSRFNQVLTNILSNAIKNTPPEGKIFVNLNEIPGPVLLSATCTSCMMILIACSSQPALSNSCFI